MLYKVATLVTALLAGSAAAKAPSWDEWAHGRVVVNNITMHYRYAGHGPPLLLVHGNPQHSITWRLLGPLMAEKYTVIAPDNRGMGDSTIPPDGDYTSEAMASDLEGLLDYLNITKANIFSHDKGTGAAVALAMKRPSLVAALGVVEYGLPGHGYEQAWTPTYTWDTYGLWPLAAWAVPDEAERFMEGREREVVLSFFFHASYTGISGFPAYAIDSVVDSLRKPGGLRAMFGAFGARTMGLDAAFFGALNKKPLTVPFLAMAGEASLADVLKPVWGPIGKNTVLDIVPQSGHFPADENPEWLEQRLNKFFDPYLHQLKVADLSVLKNRVTLVPPI
ncbi:putative hydrolase [Trichoderma sp. SZMC 28013]